MMATGVLDTPISYAVFGVGGPRLIRKIQREEEGRPLVIG
jgi:hypothetical protein